MRLLANENIPGDVVARLRDDGHDVAWVHETAPGIPDETVLRMACEQQRILLTFDKGFEEMACRRAVEGVCGVILGRIPMFSSRYAAGIVGAAMRSRDDWAGRFSVIEPHRVRMRPLA